MEFLTAYDTGEGFFERYIIKFNTGEQYSMSFNADSPQGLCSFDGFFCTTPDNWQEILFKDLPQGVKNQIRYLESEGFK